MAFCGEIDALDARFGRAVGVGVLLNFLNKVELNGSEFGGKSGDVGGRGAVEGLDFDELELSLSLPCRRVDRAFEARAFGKEEELRAPVEGAEELAVFTRGEGDGGLWRRGRGGELWRGYHWDS